ncbi:hypothetical protein IW492_13890 [Enterococcus sp. BWB1-3]|uniref:hypothetical protein n=1 Tax=Enterococcus sp. BWB1-3 TaxID=2787713 RepID=UPI001923B2A4|nr:hypothetical protein [Enterococcus sp. BWB1-3]MBL1230324.1 hypothetical protein [Enterococcus sp. BWB1-3]
MLIFNSLKEVLHKKIFKIVLIVCLISLFIYFFEPIYTTLKLFIDYPFSIIGLLFFIVLISIAIYSDRISNRNMREYYEKYKGPDKHYSDILQNIQFLAIDEIYNKTNNVFEMDLYLLNKSDEELISIDGKAIFYKIDRDVHYEKLVEISFNETDLNPKTKKKFQTIPSTSKWNFFEIQVYNATFENNKIENKIFKSKRFFRNSAWILSYFRLLDKKIGPFSTPFNLYWFKEKVRLYTRHIHSHCKQEIFFNFDLFDPSEEDLKELKLHMRSIKRNKILIFFAISAITIVLTISICQFFYVLVQLLYILGKWIANFLI